MKKVMYTVIILGGLMSFTSCATDEECVCDNSANLTESDAKDAGVSLDTACDIAKIGDATCKVE